MNSYNGNNNLDNNQIIDDRLNGDIKDDLQIELK